MQVLEPSYEKSTLQWGTCATGHAVAIQAGLVLCDFLLRTFALMT